MNILCEQIASFFKCNNFEVQPMSFDNITNSEELGFLRNFNKFKMNDAFLILRHYPHFFAFHRTVAPTKGIFFIVAVLPQHTLDNEALQIYKKYFPNPILVVSKDNQSNLIAKWLNSASKPKLIDEVLNQYLNE